MNTEFRRLISDAIEDSALHLDTHFRVSPVNIAYCREACVTGTETQGVLLRGQPVQAKPIEAVS